MNAQHHIKLINNALKQYFSPVALKVIIKSNLRQDSVFGQIGHNEYHFDNNAIDEGNRFIKSQRVKIYTYLIINKPKKAWQAFGRLLHAAQDFYAHTNYVNLWQNKQNNKLLLKENLNYLDNEILDHPFLYSHTPYFPLDYIISAIPSTGKYLTKYLPKNSHAKMNLDSPASGEDFEWAFLAALGRTEYEYSVIRNFLITKDSSLLDLFNDK